MSKAHSFDMDKQKDRHDASLRFYIVLTRILCILLVLSSICILMLFPIFNNKSFQMSSRLDMNDIKITTTSSSTSSSTPKPTFEPTPKTTPEPAPKTTPTPTPEPTPKLTSKSMPEQTSKPTPTSKKSFIYLITGREWKESYRIKPNDHRDVVFLSFGSPSTVANTEEMTVIYRPDTTWTESRNILLE